MKGRSYNYKQQDSSEWLQKYAEDDFEDIDEPKDLMDDEEMIMPDEAFVDIYDSDPTFEPLYDTIKDYDIECGEDECCDHCEFMEEKSVVTCDGREIKCVLTYDSDDGKYYVTEYDSEAAEGDEGIAMSFDSREDAFTWFDTYSTADDIFDEEDAFGTSTFVANLPSRPAVISPLDTEYISVEEKGEIEFTANILDDDGNIMDEEQITIIPSEVEYLVDVDDGTTDIHFVDGSWRNIKDKFKSVLKTLDGIDSKTLMEWEVVNVTSKKLLSEPFHIAIDPEEVEDVSESDEYATIIEIGGCKFLIAINVDDYNAEVERAKAMSANGYHESMNHVSRGRRLMEEKEEKGAGGGNRNFF